MGKFSFVGVFELSDLLIFSLTICVINLNINIEQKKNWFEKFLRLVFLIIIIMNCLFLGFQHLKIKLNNMDIYIKYIAIGFPIISGIIYKFKYQKEDE